MSLREALADWQDLDVAGYKLAIALGVISPDVDFHQAFKHIMWTDNPVGNGLIHIVRELVGMGVLEEFNERVRWREGFG